MNHLSTVPLSQRDVSADTRDRADPRLVLADRVDQLYGQMWLMLVATFAIGAIATFEFWSDRLKDLVLFWWGLVLFVTAASAGLLYAYRRAGDRAKAPEQWLRWFG